MVEKEDGRVVTISPVASTTKSDEDLAAFMTAAGSWHDVDTDRLIEDIYESREASSRPHIAL